MTGNFLDLYSPEAPRWDNITSLASELGWTDLIAQSTSEYLDTHGVSPKFSREMVEAATRVNYGQDVDKLHALEGLCSMATGGASSVVGGNFQIFEQFLLRSKANMFLSSTVRPIKTFEKTFVADYMHSRSIASNGSPISHLHGQCVLIADRRSTKRLSSQLLSIQPESAFHRPSHPKYPSNLTSIYMSLSWQPPPLNQTQNTSLSLLAQKFPPWC